MSPGSKPAPPSIKPYTAVTSSGAAGQAPAGPLITGPLTPSHQVVATRAKLGSRETVNGGSAVTQTSANEAPVGSVVAVKLTNETRPLKFEAGKRPSPTVGGRELSSCATLVSDTSSVASAKCGNTSINSN